MLNLAPQDNDFNRAGHWRMVETDIAQEAKRLGDGLRYVQWEVIMWNNIYNRPIKYLVYFLVINTGGVTVYDNAVEFE
jgi:hypothetical protein